MIVLAVLALLLAPLVLGPWAYVLALGLFALAALDVDGRRRERRLAVRRATRRGRT